MYRTSGFKKRDPYLRWSLPDRVFFACGACHILAYAFLERHATLNMEALWFRPAPGHTGNHIFIAKDEWVFDYHGYSNRSRFLEHSFRRARHFWPEWDATLIRLPREVLISECKSKTYEGLWLREPK